MPRLKARVKNKSVSRSLESSRFTAITGPARGPLPGPIDLHFHGALGTDFMSAGEDELEALSRKLGRRGLAGFCATTLSVEAAPLSATVARLGQWIRRNHDRLANERKALGSLPLGIHLEGPFLSPNARGAHPPGAIRPFQLEELDDLWDKSQGTLKILTVAPEILTPRELTQLAQWCRNHQIHLSSGHSRATEAQATAAFDAGFTGVTHAWNALAFHHREPGILGAALGRKDIALEIILDQIHVHPTLVRWTHALHSGGPICWISDGAPAAGLKEGQTAAFGPLKIQWKAGACRVLSKDERDSPLAGGGLLLPDCFARYVEKESARLGLSPAALLPRYLPFVTRFPQKVLGISNRSVLGQALARRLVQWKTTPSGSSTRPAKILPVAQFF